MSRWFAWLQHDGEVDLVAALEAKKAELLEEVSAIDEKIAKLTSKNED